jgi:putative colanic acid biosynthesis acetyltransferase WcaF
LRIFGAKIGLGVVIKPSVRVKYPWRLEIGDYCWIGEEAWIDNLEAVRIEANVCVSQGVYLCTGNHDWTDPFFRLITAPILICEGAWIGAKAILCPGVQVGAGAVAAAGSVVTKSMDAYTIYAGNPARAIQRRILRESTRDPSTVRV